MNQGMKYNLLIVEDEDIIRQVMERAFRSEKQYLLHFAKDGGEVFEVLSKMTPDLILLDIKLPVLNGFEVLARIHELGIKTRIIMNSAYYTDFDAVIKCVINGACDYVQKPVNFKELKEKMKRALLLESTYNTSISNTPTIKALVGETEKLRFEYQKLRAEHHKLQGKYNRLLLKKVSQKFIIKIVYAVLSFIITYLAYRYTGLTNTTYLLILFMVTFLLLIIPGDKIKEFSTKIFKIVMR